MNYSSILKPQSSVSQISDSSEDCENVRLQLLQNSAGEGKCHFAAKHTIFISLAPRPVRYLQTQDGKTHSAIYSKGDISLVPADSSFFARWENPENCLQIQLNKHFLADIAQQIGQNGDCLELLPEFQIRDFQIEAIAGMFLNELPTENSNRLYLDSLANVLAIHLLRNHATTKPKLVTYEGGLPPRQLNRVLDYIDTYLSENIRLADLAQVLDMSPFYFSRLFEKSLGITPHQYLIQQRIEYAKQLLRETELRIIDIALMCGFSSHSHLTKQFRKLTGVTPTNYRKIN